MDTKIGADGVLFGEFHRKASEVFFIPSLQRPYSWDAKKEVYKLWEDIVENEKPYYIGSIVSVLGEGSASKDQIIDGQQRLTTLYLILIAIRDILFNLKEKNAKDAINDIEDFLIKYRGDGKRIRLSFSNEGSNNVYRSIINGEKLDDYKTETQKRFIKNFVYLKTIINEYSGKGKYKLNRILDIIDRIKNLQIIFIECRDKSAAFRLFESINATGIGLATTDMIKNSLFESLQQDKKLFNFVETGWKEMSEEFNEDSSNLKSYIRHHWLSTVDYTSHPKLFDDFLKEYQGKESVVKYSKSLFQSAPIYNALKKGNVETLEKLNRNRNELREVKETLKFLDSLGVDQIYSVLLNVYNNEPKKFKKDLIRLSAFQFIFKYIPGSPSLLEKKFANFCKGKINRNELINELVKICSNKEKDFTNKLIEKSKYVSSGSVDVQFMLEKYLYYFGKPVSFADPTIEHIIPQDKSDSIYSLFNLDKKDIVKQINLLGNLTILEKSENSSEKKFNQEFSKKYPLYKNYVFIANSKIENYEFDKKPEEAINKRTIDIASTVYKIFFKALENGKWLRK